MKLIKKEWQHRRDFSGIYECEGCGHQQTYPYGYDDRNFHDNVTHTMECEECGESSNSLGLVPQEVSTRYSDWETV